LIGDALGRQIGIAIKIDAGGILKERLLYSGSYQQNFTNRETGYTSIVTSQESHTERMNLLSERTPRMK